MIALCDAVVRLCRVLGFSLCLATAIGLFAIETEANGQAQDALEVEPSKATDLPMVALEQIQKEYIDYLAQRKRLHDEYQKILETIQKTEEDFQRIGNDSMRQQLMAMQSSMLSMQLEASISATPGLAAPLGGRSLFQRELDNGRREALIRNKMMVDLSSAMRGEELRQLDAAAQATVRRRIECLETGFGLQQQWLQWQADWPKYMDRYWPHTDPERRFTRAEIEDRLKVLRNSDAEDYAAAITSALLTDRLGEHDAAISIIDNVLEAKTALQSTALLTKASIQLSQNDGKLAKTSLAAAAKFRSQSPTDRWLRARIAAMQQQPGAAETEWKALVNLKSFELEARRGLALLYCARSESARPVGKKALKEAQLAFDLEPRHDWFPHFVLSLALYVNDYPDLALKQLDQAEEKATDENLELCHRLRQSIRDSTAFAWDFKNILAQPEPTP